MNRVVSWPELLELVEPVYPKAGNGRHPVGLAIMLRTCFLQQWFGLSGPGMGEAFYESAVLQRFAGVDLGVVYLEAEKWTHRVKKGKGQHATSHRKQLHKQEIICGRVAATKSRTCAEVPLGSLR
jgi:IS5 family transposase